MLEVHRGVWELNACDIGGAAHEPGARRPVADQREYSVEGDLSKQFKIAVKGGVVGLAATLAASAVWCATPWA
ncbi:hypothetical protein ACWGI0_02095 [Streptomyces sp. NPDC054802]